MIWFAPTWIISWTVCSIHELKQCNIALTYICVLSDHCEMNCPIITLFDTHSHWETAVCNFHLNSSLCAHSLFLEIPGNSHTNHLQLPVQLSLGKLDLWTNYCTLYYCTLYTASMHMCMHVLYVCVCEWEWEREERERERESVCVCVCVC